MTLKRKFKTDSKSANEGIKIKYNDSPNSDGSIPVFTLARMSSQNKKYVTKLRNANETIQAKYGVTEMSKLSEDQDKEMSLELFVETVLLGWENFEIEDGVKLEYSTENAKKVFGDPDWIDLYTDLKENALKQANFSKSLVESIAKN